MRSRWFCSWTLTRLCLCVSSSSVVDNRVHIEVVVITYVTCVLYVFQWMSDKLCDNSVFRVFVDSFVVTNLISRCRPVDGSWVLGPRHWRSNGDLVRASPLISLCRSVSQLFTHHIGYRFVGVPRVLALIADRVVHSDWWSSVLAAPVARSTGRRPK